MSSQRSDNPVRSSMSTLSFFACLALLIAFVGHFNSIIRKTGMRPGPKEPVYLRQPLSRLDPKKLAPYETVQAVEISDEVLNQLGTRDYIQWMLRNTEDRQSATSVMSLFVTYYTDNPGQVVHIPDECYLGSGFNRKGGDLIQIPIQLSPQQTVMVPLHVLKFQKNSYAGEETRVVMYGFHVNGQFAAEGRAVSNIMNDPKTRHGYFSKVEVSFGNGNVSVPYDDAVAAGKQLLQKVLPILVQDHWPDWQAVETQEKQETKKQTAEKQDIKKQDVEKPTTQKQEVEKPIVETQPVIETQAAEEKQAVEKQ